jgi:hypothetical protein
MTLVWAVGQKITAARLNLRNPITARKTVTVALASDNTVNSDPDLVLPLKANTTYDIYGLLLVTSAVSTTGKFQYGWAWTNTVTNIMGAEGDHNGAAASGAIGEWATNTEDNTSPSLTLPYAALTAPTGVRINDRAVVGSLDSVLTLQWSQQAVSANVTSLVVGSYITAFPVL